MRFRIIVLIFVAAIMILSAACSSGKSEQGLQAGSLPEVAAETSVKLGELKPEMHVKNAYNEDVVLTFSAELTTILTEKEVEDALESGYGKGIPRIHFYAQSELEKAEKIQVLQYVYVSHVGLVGIAVNESIVEKMTGKDLIDFLKPEQGLKKGDFISVNRLNQ